MLVRNNYRKKNTRDISEPDKEYASKNAIFSKNLPIIDQKSGWATFISE